MRYRKLDSNSDMQFGHSSADFWHDRPEAVGQSVMTRLLLFRGEWFLDVTEGTPWGGFPLNQSVVDQGEILAEHTQLSRDAALRERVIGTPGALAISNYNSHFDPNTRDFAAAMLIDTVYGRLALSIDGLDPPSIRFKAVT
jgi:hypothetical protein